VELPIVLAGLGLRVETLKNDAAVQLHSLPLR
jgi:hypothetical protein